MANRLVGNVYIIDSGTINLVWPTNAAVAGFTLYGTDSTSRMNITYASNISDSVVSLANPVNTPQLVGVSFGVNGVHFDQQLRVNTLTAGTGYIYFV